MAAGPSGSATVLANETNDQNLEVPYCMNYIMKQRIFEIKITKIYDPSKLWISLPHDLKKFTLELNSFYLEYGRKVPHHELKDTMVCIIHKNNSFYRATILKETAPHPQKSKIFLIDIGWVCTVHNKHIYYIERKHCETPRLAFRARILYIAPLNEAQTWTVHELNYLKFLIKGQQCFGLIESSTMANKILHIQMFIRSPEHQTPLNISVAWLMKECGIAKEMIEIQKKVHRECDPECIIHYPYLLPTFQDIEEGKCPFLKKASRQRK